VKKTIYTAFGLRVTSDIPLPELSIARDDDIHADIEIMIADLPKFWNDEVSEANHLSYAVKDHQVFFHIPKAASFCIQEGKRIIVSPMMGSDINKVRLFLLGSCMGALLMQRRILPLHGSAVVIDGKAYAFVGESGAGKSTLAAAFLSKGFPLLSDDVIPISLSADGAFPVVSPAYPQQKLWQESLVKLDMDTNLYSPLTHEVEKFAVPVSSQFYAGSVPLAGVFEVVKLENGETEIRRIQKLERFRIFNSHTYRNFLIPLLELEEWHFTFCSNLINHAAVYQLRRLDSGFTAHDLASQILDTISEGA
jgi:hypothetical protein